MGCTCNEIQKKGISRNSSKTKYENKEDKNKGKKKKGNIIKGNEIKEIGINKLEEKRAKEYLEKLYKSYYSAKTYFCLNELKEKEVDAICKLRKITSAQDLLKEGKYKRINIKELPGEMTSEYITDKKEEERQKEIKKIIKCLEKEKEIAQKEMDEKLNELKLNIKNIKKEDVNNFKKESKIILDKQKIKIENISKDIARVKETLKSEYIPVPYYIMGFEEYQMQKINNDIPENIIRINISNLTYSKSNPLIILNLKINDDINMMKEIKGKNNNDINATFDWKINESNYKSIIKSRIDIILERTYTIKSNKKKGSSNISLRQLSSRSLIEESCKIEMDSGKSNEYIDISIKIRTPFFEKEYESSYREVLKIQKIYPQFSINEEKENFNDNDDSLDKLFEEIQKNNKK